MFELTAKQQEAQEVLNGPAKHVMLAGGSRSGKTALIVRKIIQRALKAPGSRHAILRFRLGHVKQSIMYDTLPTIMDKCFPSVDIELNKSDMFARLPGGSEIWLGGLDDKERTEKILGTEFASIFLNECSQIPYGSRNIVVTRLAQRVMDRATGQPLRLKMYYDENPPDKGHWTYRLFKTKVDPETRAELRDPEDYAFVQINPGDNQANLPADYLKTLETLPPRLRKRFLEGEFRDANPGAFFNEENFERWRNIDGELPDMLRIVVAVDPSGADDADNQENDAIGIVVCGLGVDGNGYVLEDLTCKCSPERWGKVAVSAFDRHSADRIVAEVNYGGAMVGAVIRAARPRTPFRPVTASRGKVVRAEPISLLVETGKIRMAGIFRELEDELCGFTTHGYMGENSPNRADACLAAGSLVETDRGLVPIEHVVVGDRVMTRQGWKPVVWSGMTRIDAPTKVLTLSHGRSIVGTDEHPIWVDGRGFVPLTEIKPSDALMPAERVWTTHRQRSNSTAAVIGAIPIIRPKSANATTGASAARAMASCIATSGNSITGRFRRAVKSIIAMATGSTTRSTTFNACRQESMPPSTPAKSGERGTSKDSRSRAWPPALGMDLLLASLGMPNMGVQHGRAAWPVQSVLATTAGNRWNPPSPAGPTTTAVRESATTLWPRSSDAITPNGHALSAAICSSVANTTRPSNPVVVLAVRNGERMPVYNLHVEDCHEFIANGVLVHNCIWGMTDLFPELVKQDQKPAAPPPRVVVRSRGANAWMRT